METPIARYAGDHPPPIVPGPLGAHSWQPMSFSPLTGQVYIPVNDLGFLYKSPEHFEARKFAPNYGIDVVAAGMPQDPEIKKAILATVKGKLVAWDPVHQKQVLGGRTARPLERRPALDRRESGVRGHSRRPL